MKIGIRELKAHLSRYVEAASEGTTVVVTDRGRPKAVLGPASLVEQSESIGEKIQRGARQGWITPATARKPDFLARKGFKGNRTVQELMDNDRGD